MAATKNEPKKAKILKVPSPETGYKWVIKDEDENGDYYYLMSNQVVGKPEVGTIGLIQYQSTSTRGWFTFTY